MFCFIPAAGFGKRMNSLTKELPKPLLEVNGITLLDRTIFSVYKLGITDFIINTHYLADKIHKHLFKYLKKLNIIISYEKEKILGTAGGIKTGIENNFLNDELFLTINPDTLIDFPINFLNDSIRYKKNPRLFLAQKKNQDDYTGLSLKDENIYFENGEYYYIGLSILNRSMFKNVTLNEYSDLSDIFKNLSNQDQLYGELFDSISYDVGDQSKYEKYLDSNLDDSDLIKFLNNLP
jgi:N-acetyl-alpha-D-muramate 1-phosphate uridylyltransferase